MTQSRHYRIDYLLDGHFKSFYISARAMSDAEAWHWAAVDSGVAPIPRYRREKVRVVSKPLAELHGIAEVLWSQA
ncbi:hypothetical protein BW687_002090 [Pseudomonas graminis]|uniref:DUF6555 family protein n=1 Tax=Pseudomonas graminis TaxID=158627 RepID=UPI002349435C|nr:DUF6555 family protein [Pseudomonas graminis]MDC6378964.1 hypothetical protein [Pseudomonas graminis]